jgi:WD40 repeat protein
LAGGIAAIGLLMEVGDPTADGEPVPLIPHPGDALPSRAIARLGTTRLCHLPERGNEGISDLAFSPDGGSLATLGSQDSCISLWEVPGGRLLRKWDADDADRCGQLAFSPCGRFLAVGSNDGLRLWNPHAGRLVRQFADSRKCVYGLAFSPDGKLLAAAVPFDGVIDVWDVSTGDLATRFESDPHPLWPGSGERSDQFNGVTFAADGQLVAAAAEYQLYHDVPATDARALEARLLELYGSCRSLSRDGKSYLVEPRGRVWCWDLASGRRVAKLEGHKFPVERVCFTAGGRLASGSKDGAVWKWDLAAGRRIGELAPSANRSYDTSITFTPDGRYAVVSRRGYLGLIDLPDGRELRQFTVAATWRGWAPLAVCPNVRWVATADQGRISLWDVTTGAEVSPRPRHAGWVQAVRFTADGFRVVSATLGDAML